MSVAKAERVLALMAELDRTLILIETLSAEEMSLIPALSDLAENIYEKRKVIAEEMERLQANQPQELVRTRPLTEKQIEEARQTIANQYSTLPKDGDIGPEGAWHRAEPMDASGHRLKRSSND